MPCSSTGYRVRGLIRRARLSCYTQECSGARSCQLQGSKSLEQAMWECHSSNISKRPKKPPKPLNENSPLVETFKEYKVRHQNFETQATLPALNSTFKTWKALSLLRTVRHLHLEQTTKVRSWRIDHPLKLVATECTMLLQGLISSTKCRLISSEWLQKAANRVHSNK